MAKFCSKCGADLSESNGICKKCQDSFKYSNDGVINRKALKEAAKEKISGNLFNIWKPMLVIFGIMFLLGIVEGIFLENGNLFSSVVSLLITIASAPLTMGSILYMIKFVRGDEYSLDDVFHFYDNRVWTIFVLTFLVGLFTFLWSLLFIIPGIIAAFSYSMYTYIFADETKGEPLDVIKESKRLMNGYKWDYFVFQLSFLGWAFLGCITLGIALIYVLPYMMTAQTMYYEELKKIKQD